MGKMTKKGFILMAAALIAAAAGQAQAETRFAVQDATGTVDRMVVTDTGNIGIGTNDPRMAIVVDKAGTTGDTSMLFRNAGGSPYNQFNSPAFFFMRNNPAGTNSGMPQNGDRLGSISFGSVLSTGYKYGANISAFSQGVWTGTSFPGYMTFSTTAATGTGPAERVRIDANGNVGIGTNTPGQRLEVRGGVKLNTADTKPACDTANGPTNRGTMWFTRNATGADTFEVCAKDANGNYSWVNLML